jgi:hypothetical protein
MMRMEDNLIHYLVDYVIHLYSSNDESNNQPNDELNVILLTNPRCSGAKYLLKKLPSQTNFFLFLKGIPLGANALLYLN